MKFLFCNKPWLMVGDLYMRSSKLSIRNVSVMNGIDMSSPFARENTMSSEDAERDMVLKAQQFAMKELMDSCPAKTVIGGVLGFGMGGLLLMRCALLL